MGCNKCDIICAKCNKGKNTQEHKDQCGPSKLEKVEALISQLHEVFDNKDAKKFDKKRYEDNMSILFVLVQYLKDNPSIRFGQALHNLDIVKMDKVYIGNPLLERNVWVDEYNTEPEKILKRMMKG